MAAVLATALTFIGGPAPVSAGALVREDAAGFILENETARYTFSKQFRGSVVGLLDRSSGTDFVAGLPYPAALFILATVAPECGAGGELHNLSGGTFEARGESVTGGARLHLSYSDIGGHPVAVAVTVSLADSSPRAEWRIAITSADPDVTVHEVTFPAVAMRAAIGSSSADDAVAFPILDGIAIRAPGETFHVGEGLVATYPADLSLQMACVWDPVAGLYLAVHDGTGNTKTLGYARVDMDGTAATLLLVRHAAPARAGADPAPAYPVVLGPFAGDWYDAAQHYRSWALSQRWTPPPLARRFDLPLWWKSGVPVASAVAYGDDGQPIVPPAAVPNRAREYGVRLGLPVTVLLFGWEKSGAWTGPDFFPPGGGAPSFQAAAAGLTSAGDHLYAYLSGSTWRLGRRELPQFDGSASFEAEGWILAAQRCDGTVLMDAFYGSIGWPSARMCPGAAGWQDIVVDAVKEAARLGTDAVSIDEFPVGAVYPCYAGHHGHAPGSGPWQGAAYRTMLERANREAKALNPRLVLTCEEPNELFIDLLGGYVSRENQPDGWMYGQFLERYGSRFEPVPLFAAVYHDFIVAVSEGAVIDSTWTPLETLRTSLTRSLAAGFVLGKLPAVSSVAVAQADGALLELFGTAARIVHGPAHRWAVLGRMLRPPELDVPSVTFQWLDTDLVTGALLIRDQSAPAVLASAWEATDGSVAHLLANITAEARGVSLPLATRQFQGPAQVTLLQNDVSTLLYQGASPPETVVVALAPRSLAVVAVTPHDEALPRVRTRLAQP
jgi:hypothetical protein